MRWDGMGWGVEMVVVLRMESVRNLTLIFFWLFSFFLRVRSFLFCAGSVRRRFDDDDGSLLGVGGLDHTAGAVVVGVQVQTRRAVEPVAVPGIRLVGGLAQRQFLFVPPRGRRPPPHLANRHEPELVLVLVLVVVVGPGHRPRGRCASAAARAGHARTQDEVQELLQRGHGTGDDAEVELDQSPDDGVAAVVCFFGSREVSTGNSRMGKQGTIDTYTTCRSDG